MRRVFFPAPDQTGGAGGVAATAGHTGPGAGRRFPPRVGLDAGIRDGRPASGGGSLVVFGAKAYAFAAGFLVASDCEPQSIRTIYATHVDSAFPGGIGPRRTTSIFRNCPPRRGR